MGVRWYAVPTERSLGEMGSPRRFSAEELMIWRTC